MTEKGGMTVNGRKQEIVTNEEDKDFNSCYDNWPVYVVWHL